MNSESLHDLVGREGDLREAARALTRHVQGLRAPAVGATQVSCSDEAQHETFETFRTEFVRYLLPDLKSFSKSAFLSANLGARYEWGAVRVAEDHFALARGADDWKVLLVKINAHVSAIEGKDGPIYGHAPRFGKDSTYCGALHATMAGATLPFAEDLATAFSFEGEDRLAQLRDPGQVDPAQRSLLAAVASARLQARRCMLDIQDHEPKSPTLYLVLPAVTVNRDHHDTEILCGVYTADRRSAEPRYEYRGLSDRPAAYEVDLERGLARIRDEGCEVVREARDHRELVKETWSQRSEPVSEPSERLREGVHHATGVLPHAHEPYTKAALRVLLMLLLEASPIPAAVLLFGEGLVHIHHAATVHKLARHAHDDDAAREMLREVEGKIDALEPEEARHLVELLAREYGA